MLRFLIGTGALLMAVGFGAAGLQYWQSLPSVAPAEPVAAAEAAPAAVRQSWLISPTGGLVLQEEVRAYLEQEMFVPGRSLKVRRQASLGDLLAEGEKLPEAPFLQVLADIRAPRVAEGLCPVLLETIAQDCAVHSARVVEGSVDPMEGTALFDLELVYRLKDDGGELPDLAARVLRSETIQLDFEAGAEGTATPEAALRAAVSTLAEACVAEAVGEVCRPIRLSLDWRPGQPVSARVGIAWLDPLPKGIFMAPPLQTGG